MSVRQGFMVGEKMEFELALKRAKKHDFDFIEISMEDSYHRDYLDVSNTRAKAQKHDIDVVVHFPYKIDLASPHSHVRRGACEELEKAIASAIDCGVDLGVLHADTFADPTYWGKKNLREQLYKSIRRVNSYAQNIDDNFTICVENVNSDFFNINHFSELFNKTGVNGCLDTGHSYVSGQDAESQAKLVEQHGDQISHIHLNDTRFKNKDEHLPVGFGKFDFEVFGKVIKNTNWTGTLNHEAHSYDFEYQLVGKEIFTTILERE